MSVSITDFGKLTTGQPVQLVTLKNDKIEVQLLTYAAIIHRIIVPDRKGSPTDVVLGYPTARDYELNTDSMGAAVGRFANRIGGVSPSAANCTRCLSREPSCNRIRRSVRRPDTERPYSRGTQRRPR